MRALLLFGLVLVATVSATVEVQRSYHEEIGIPLAEKIKKYEEEVRANEIPDERVVGGALAPVNAYPFFAGLLIDFVNKAGQSVCGSSLITTNRLVTAAHCWWDGRYLARMFTVILGTNWLFSGGTRIATTQVVMHPQWNTGTLNNDVAIIYLPSHVWLSSTIQPIELPNSWELWETFTGQWAVAAGYGKTSDAQQSASTVISHVNLQVITEALCARSYGSEHVIHSTLCTSGAGLVGICGGDSGGPLSLVYNGRRILIGISSFTAQDGCQLGHPSAFARVTSFISFITQHL